MDVWPDRFQQLLLAENAPRTGGEQPQGRIDLQTVGNRTRAPNTRKYQDVSSAISLARKLRRDLAAWSQSISFVPHRDFATVERIFGDVSADASDALFRFGRDGKPVYIPGPSESAHLIRRRIEQLRQHLGDDGFEIAA